jgi:GNAT superfamily N-acetyltransferase
MARTRRGSHLRRQKAPTWPFFGRFRRQRSIQRSDCLQADHTTVSPQTWTISTSEAVVAELHSLFVDKAYRKAGVATLLIKTVLDSLDPCGLPCILRATELGANLYRKLGWETIELLDITNEQGSVVHQLPVMLREAPQRISHQE